MFDIRRIVGMACLTLLGPLFFLPTLSDSDLAA